MRDLVNKILRFGGGVRHLSLFATSIFVASFVAGLVSTTTVLAADATWSGANLSYEGKTFAAAADIPAGGNRLNLLGGTHVYQYLDAKTNTLEALYIDGATKPAEATSAQYVVYKNYTPPDNFTDMSSPQTVTIVTAANPPPTANTTSCDGNITRGMGWILCPVTNFLASSMDHLYKILQDFLVVRTVYASPDNSLYKMWVMIRDIANIAFVIVFLYIVYSQVTSIGISNYGIKKMLPRLVVAAVLVNLSYWISALAVDISNFLGYAIYELFMGIFRHINTAAAMDASQSGNWESLATGILAGGGALAGAAFYGHSILAAGAGGSLYLLIPILVGVLLAVLVALVIMAARQALIVILIAISPLAFVAYTLPNTEKLFERWKSTFLTMLFLFPIFSALFGGAQLAGLTIIQNASGASEVIMIIFGMAVMVAPVVITPMLVKFSGSLLGRIAGIVNNPSKGLIDRTRNWAQERADQEKSAVMAGRRADSWMNRRTRAINLRKFERDQTKSVDEEEFQNWANRSQYMRRLDRRRRIGQMDKSNLEATNEEDFNRHVERTAELRGMRRETALAQGRSKIIEKSMDAMDNRALQAHIRATPDLHNREIQATVDEGIANAMQKNTERQGELRLQQAIDSSRDLRKMTVQTGEYERHAALIEQDLKNKADAHWERQSRQNPEIFQKRLETSATETSAAREKAQMDKIMTEVKAQGADSEFILNLRGTTPETRTQMIDIARNIKTDNFDTYIESTAQKMAERAIAQERAGVLKDTSDASESIRRRASGILSGRGGEQSVRAQARRESSKMLVDDVENIQSTTDNELATDPKWLLTQLTQNPTLSFAERIAYSNLLANAGGPGVANLRKAIAHYDEQFADKGSEDLQDYKDFMRNNGKFMGAGKDLEFWATNTRDDLGDIKSFDNLTRSPGTWSNVSIENFGQFNATSQLRMLQVLATGGPRDRQLYNEIVADLHKNDDEGLRKLKPMVRNAIQRNNWGDPSDPYAIRTGIIVDGIGPSDVY